MKEFRDDKAAKEAAKKGGSGKSMAMANKTITVKMPKTVSSPTAGKANKIVGTTSTQTKSKG